ncbi:restriction endonuclease subunit S [Vibrio vulnificus]|uniref:restriction endonuclease subunit S n=1 Tax=Vibrio vulnificus TaxID=672 RepID=UPI001593A9F1|nr:restriction endonuclease subunit S [Vibrio vulnificus]EID4388348.1 restriction endonuclease subunit S [Vibrio vulnificus]NVC71292.1 restriction endonuclease [Vibrio vulnificus]
MSWPMVKLRKLVVANYGKALKKEVRDENGDIEVFGSAGLVGFHNESLFEQQTIVIGRKGSVGKVIWAPKGGWVIDTAYYLTVKENVVLDWRYLFYVLQNVRLDSKTITTSIPGLNRDDFYDTEIPLPPIEQQKRIAAILDKADAIRQKRKQAIALADEFLRSVFLDMFGDPVNNPKGFPLGTIRDLVESANYGTSGKASESEGEYPVLRMGNITYQGSWDFSDLKYIDLTEKELPKYLVHKGDLLFNRTNSRELVGKTAVYEEELPMAFAGYLVRVRANEMGNTYYLSGYLNSGHGKKVLSGMCKSIVGMANINAQELQNIKLLLPPIELQNRYEEIVKAVRSRVSTQIVSLTELNELFSSLSQKAFSGQL